ncbi:RimJ/RimL family protein N-acetyltransferase [Paenibacillus turicensis]|uniref:RimJ/RimL family protein N-acetyltransferase n=1 Tax=Paenibacillus turicensis TaxID=160487 RepID=A0ABS4FN54_9BACL|nr:GNAT family N-acetyltransferase [Paenibacillus turicensis]MBP1904011.1 RimJ/RimL family protein N-acetyltransferase [Paenibacillus turicensis]
MEEIVTDRLVIRSFNPNDWKDLYEYLSDEEVVKFEPYDTFSENQAIEEAMRRSQDESFYAVCLKEKLKDNQKIIGNLYLAKGEFDTWELGYVFNSKYQGIGYATESAKALVEYAFTNLGARRILAHCSPQNDSSWKLLERLQMRREGLFLENVYFKRDDNEMPIWLDSYQYAILKTEWHS